MLKRVVCGLFVLLLICVCSMFFIYDYRRLVMVDAEVISAEQVIIIDAGHGGFDGGAVASDGTIEKDINLDIALKLNDLLMAFGYKTIMVRTDDTSTDDLDVSGSKKASDIKNRVKLMQKYENSIFVSIHMNKYSTSQPNGAQVFYSLFGDSKNMAESIQSSIAGLLQVGNKRVVKPTTKDIYLLSHATVPAVIVECGFLSNPSDLANFKDDDYRKKMAFCIADGLINYL